MLSFISLSYHIQHSSNLYNKAYFDTTPLSTKQGIFLQNGNLLHGSVWRGICDDILLAPGGAYSFIVFAMVKAERFRSELKGHESAA